jgi:hypothetical protein
MEVRFAKHQLVELTRPRSLTHHERQVLELLVRGSEAASCQVAHAAVAEECVDRCGSLAMAIPRDGCGQIATANGLLANAEWRRGEQASDVQDVLLFVVDGFLSLLETYRGDGQVPPGLRRAADLTMLIGPDGPIPWPDAPSSGADV